MSIFQKILTFGCLLFASTSVPAEPLFISDGKLSDGCIALCKALKIKAATPQEFNECFQRYLGECYKDFTRKPKCTLREFTVACGLLGVLEEVLPKRDSYDYIVIIGSDTESMEEECSFLKNELESILANNPSIKIYFLTETRPLNWQVDSVAIVRELQDGDLELTETNAARLIWEKFFGRSPLGCNFVDVEIDPVSREWPPGAATMYRLLEEHAYLPGAMLLISVNPFIAYQDIVCRNICKQKGWFAGGGSLETVGYGVSCQRFGVKFVVNVLLDAIAKLAFEEMKFLTAGDQ